MPIFKLQHVITYATSRIKPSTVILIGHCQMQQETMSRASETQCRHYNCWVTPPTTHKKILKHDLHVQHNYMIYFLVMESVMVSFLWDIPTFSPAPKSGLFLLFDNFFPYSFSFWTIEFTSIQHNLFPKSLQNTFSVNCDVHTRIFFVFYYGLSLVSPFHVGFFIRPNNIRKCGFVVVHASFWHAHTYIVP